MGLFQQVIASSIQRHVRQANDHELAIYAPQRSQYHAGKCFRLQAEGSLWL